MKMYNYYNIQHVLLFYLCFVITGRCSIPHTGELLPLEPADNTNNNNSNEDSEEEITYTQARKYNGTWCPSMQPQRSLDIDQLMGIWHVVEIILHRENSKSNKPPKNPAPTISVPGCPTIHLNRNPVNKDVLSLLWNEEAGFLEYRFQMAYLDSEIGPGYWLSYGPQNGSLTQLPDKPYTQFAGTVQVMKAINTHMVLTFCSPNSQLYSAVVSRTVPLVRSELRGIHTMLQRRGLQNVAFTETCRSIATNYKQSLVLILICFMISQFRKV